ncbi:hypothetical protein MKX01_038933 [Papaver californicum]|nr:hypothetical protein MKX01_038933 [Papaver californicum]
MDQEMTEIRVGGGTEEQSEQQNNSTIRREFKHFDVITTENDIKDHHYFSSTSSLSSTGNESSLIYVRVYEGGIDLLRAVIVGPTGTPYHDGLFFFDIKFLSDYPNSPAKVHYHSFGHRSNPNLYQNGFVCLSLLNTWSGNVNEKWKPSQSTILQVLVSIQGLVLNAKSYFNEPAFANLPKNFDPWKANSLSYNRNAFILSCKTMLCVLRRPPKFFEEIVNLTSRTFKASMVNVYSQLIKSFRENGSSLENFEILDTSNNVYYYYLSKAKSMCGPFIWVTVVLVFCVGFGRLLIKAQGK